MPPAGPIGWVEYPFSVGMAGWYELIAHGADNGAEYMIDPKDESLRASGTVFVGARIAGAQRQQIGNVWLTAGEHRLRLQRLYWTGLPPISEMELKPAGHSVGNAFAIVPAGDTRIFRKGQCDGIDLVGGGTGSESTYQVFEQQSRDHKSRRTETIVFPATDEPTRLHIDLPCNAEGEITLSFGVNDRPIASLGKLNYEVIDTFVPASESSAPDELVREIDCEKRAPEYSAGTSVVVASSFGNYRESVGLGWKSYQQLPAKAIRNAPQPGWFAYKLDDLTPQQRYRIEVDYPDDKRRTFAIALRESSPLSYPLAIGVTAGGEYSLSKAIATQAMTIWPRTSFPRLLFATTHDGEPAACSRIRVYKAAWQEPLTPRDAANKGRRQVVHWFEEGKNYESLFGPPISDPGASRVAAERWIETARANGVNMLMPTAVVYGMGLFPTTHEITEFRPEVDDLRRLVLLAEKNEIKIVPEIHPRADALSWGYENGKAPPDNLLVSKDGKTNFFAGDGKTRNMPPYFDPLDQRVQSWYLDLIGEIADRYRDSSAFDGVSLRVMQWSNGAFSNLVNLDWGYGDRSVAMFRKETGLPVPLGKDGDANRFAERYKWLTTIGREAWVTWRCRKIADLMVRARDRLRQARPDLKLFLHIFNGDVADAPGFIGSRNPARDRLRESGIDPSMLHGIDGIVPIDSSYAYGRFDSNGVFAGSHDRLLDPAALSTLNGIDPGSFIFGGYYLEATEVVVPPAQLGFMGNTKATWMSAVGNPAGRHALERYAIPLAEADALMLGDGGNSYTFSPPLIREFLVEYAMLPNQSFTSRADAIDPVTVRTLRTDGGTMFYAVNRERYPVTTKIVLNRPAKAQRVSTGTSISSIGKSISLDLKPYELIVLRLEAGVEIASVRTDVPMAARRLVENRLAWVKRLSASNRLSNAAEKITLDAAVAAASVALKQERLWRARTVLEHNAMLAIYHRLDCYPTDLFSGDHPVRTCQP